MSAFTRSVTQAFTGAVRALGAFPASIGSALCFAAVTVVRIQLDWPAQEPYNFLFNCLHWSLALGAVFSLAVITAAHSRFNTKKAFIFANALGAAAVAVTFVSLYFWGGLERSITGSRYAAISAIAVARVSAAMLVSALAFIVLASWPREKSDFSRSLFIAHKAFFVSLFYGLVILGGASGVAGAFQALLYSEMSGKVYGVIATLAGLVAYTLFVGYFPDFRRGREDPKREVAQKQPRFIEILLVYILIPIVLALTAVLLAWAVKTVLAGMGASSFMRLSGIATSYAVAGLWLHIMVTHSDAGLAKLYRRVYPVAALVILAFAAWALAVRLDASGLKTAEYAFSLSLILTASAVVLLLIVKSKAHVPIAAITCALAVFAVLPAVGYHALPVRAQIGRLQNILTSQNMLRGTELAPAAMEPEKAVRIAVTDAVEFLAYAEGAKLPAWFDPDLAEADVFKEKLGFQKTWPETDPAEPGGGYRGTYLTLPPKPVVISGYTWAVNPQNMGSKDDSSVEIDGERGVYKVDWTDTYTSGIPTLRITWGDTVLLDQDLGGYLDQIAAKYPPGQSESRQALLEDMILEIETPELSLLLVFSNVQITVDTQRDETTYWIGLNAIYIRENP